MKRTSGSALLLVLGMIVLVSALVLAFLASVSSELNSSKTYANGATVKQLADSATQLVMSQIVSATGNTNSTLAWASQPGMIRTYDTSGNPAYFYKLYSSAGMITNAAASAFNPANEVPPATWDSANNAGIYTDLNSPVSSSGTNYFPIVDPRAYTSSTTTSVEGFTYTSSVDGVVQPSAGASSQRLPMPVMWLYVLQNGVLATPISSSSGTVTFDTTDPTKVPSASNPIVGRVAFWTDDETCKVNINTASEGTFWDRPWANTTTEQNFSTAIPGQNEFQRYPGHPAKTCLSSVFGPLGFPTPWPSSAWYYGISTSTLTSNLAQLAAYYGVTPRVADGGTEAGSVNEQVAAGATSSVNSAFHAVALDGDRLYASPDELLYAPTNSASSMRAPNTPNGTTMTSSVLEKAKFFITAHSRAPEVNLFGKPRMTLWPLQDSTNRNAKDGLIAFCSTIGGNNFYFQRATTYSAASPSTSSSQSATLDWTAVPRNQALYSYLDNLTQQKIPGFGGKFSSKYPSSRQQILTEMFDMIRSGVNGYSNGLTPQYNYAPPYLAIGEGQVVPLVPPSGTPGAGTHGFGRFVTLSGASIVFYRSNASALQVPSPVKTDPNQRTILNPSGAVMTTGAQIGAVLILNPVTICPGFPPWSPNVTYKVTGLDQFKITSPSMGTTFQSLGFQTPLLNTTTARSEWSGTGNCTPFFNVASAFRYGGLGGDVSKTQPTASADPIKQYPFMVPVTGGTGVQLQPSDLTFDFNSDSTSGHAITVTIYAGADTAQTTPIQTITMNFPPSKGLLVPTTYPGGAFYQYLNRFSEGASPTTSITKADRERIIMYTGTLSPSTTPGNIASLGNDSSGAPVNYYMEDIARGVEADGVTAAASNPAQGDYRVFAALPVVPSSYFTTSPGYDAATAANIATYPGLPNGFQTYTNAQALRDQGLDGGSTSLIGFGADAGFPGGYYTHWATAPGGATNGNTTRDQIFASTIATGILVPQLQLATYSGPTGQGSNVGDHEYRSSARPAVPSGLGLGAASATISGGYAGDWDNLTGLMEDGPFINKPDEGNSSTASNTSNIENLNVYYGGTVDISGGYFSPGMGPNNGVDYQQESGTTFSPNRQVSSAVMFGSLPTGIDPSGATAPKPWQTLLFCANPAASSNHPGFGAPTSGSAGANEAPPYTTPPDHLLLDLFTMPVVEPYAISEPLSTAGKINMNYQILPFSYITRDTGVRAVLKSTRIMAVPQGASTVTGASQTASYKDGKQCPDEMRYNVNPDETVGTLAGFQSRFGNGDIFRCASEICGIYLVPQLIPQLSTGMSYPTGSAVPGSYAGTGAWWNNFLLTGDNSREFPYGDIYSRLTTKSNTYTVHVRVQTLKQALPPGSSATAWSQWREGTDVVTGEYRGSSLVERYVDTSDPALPDFAQASSPSVEGYYKMRVVSSKKFAP